TTTTELFASASGLTPATNYQLYIMSDCGAETSLWSLPVSLQTPCDGTPDAGTLSATETSVCPTTTFTLSLTGASAAATGISYHWQSSTTGAAPWTDMTGSAASLNVTGQSQATYYRAYVACSGSGLADTTDAVFVAQNPGTACYCIPTYTYGCGNGATLNSVSVTGGIQNVSNTGTGCGGAYTNYSSTLGVIATQGTLLNFTANVTAYYGGVHVWVDWNQDGVFTTDEKVVQSPSTVYGNYNSSFTVPITAIPGVTRMRVRVVESNTNFDPCANYFYGETEDYAFTVIGLEDCAGTPAPGLTMAAQSDFCVSGSTILTLENSYITYSGISWQWQNSTDGGDTWNNIPGATSFNYTTSTVAATTMFRCMVTCNADTDNPGYSTPVTLNIHGLPTISVDPHTAAFCSSAPVALTASGAQTYSWSPSTGLDATTGTTVNASPASLITYTVTGTDINGCVSTATAVVGPITAIPLTGSVSYSGACEA